jgi:hypothetical protein
MWDNKKMGQDKELERRLTLMVASSKGNGRMTKNMEMVSFNILMEPSMMDNGKMISDKVTELIPIQMVTNMKEIGQMIYRKAWGHTTMQMEIFTKGNGKMAGQMEKETIFIKAEKLFTREIGLKVKSKGSDSLLLTIITDIQANGRTIKKKEKVAIYTQTDRNMTVNGREIKSLVLGPINIKMETYTLEVGKMIDDQEMEK